MKKIIVLLLLPFLLTSCGVSINSVVEDSAVHHDYSNPLVVIPYGADGTENFSKKLKGHIEAHFTADDQKIEVFAFEQQEKKLSLNTENDIDQKIQNAIINEGKDLLLVIKPENLFYNNGSLQVADYQLTGIDTRTGDEVWKANFRSRSFFGPAFFAKKSAKIIYEKLKTDKIL